MTRPLDNAFGLYVAGTGGVGYDVAKETARRGALTALTSRREEKARRVAEQMMSELKAEGFDSRVYGIEFDPAVDSIDALVHELDGAVQAGRDHLYIGWIPGVTDLEYLERSTDFAFDHYPDEQETIDLISASGPQALEQLRNTNYKKHEELFEAAKKLSVPVTYWFMSSQAASEEFYPFGNWEYGLHGKKAGEDAMVDAPDHIQAYATRVGFFGSDTGGGLYPLIVRIESHKPEEDRDFWNADEKRFSRFDEIARSVETVSQALAGLVLDGSHPFMRQKPDEPHVYSFDNRG